MEMLVNYFYNNKLHFATYSGIMQLKALNRGKVNEKKDYFDTGYGDNRLNCM